MKFCHLRAVSNSDGKYWYFIDIKVKVNMIICIFSGIFTSREAYVIMCANVSSLCKLNEPFFYQWIKPICYYHSSVNYFCHNLQVTWYLIIIYWCHDFKQNGFYFISKAKSTCVTEATLTVLSVAVFTY